ncbi:hypothetical protein VOLCADRAFT_102664 [Volvox carteri f. nagariensis]|uniref:Uncharacterized protein n=1 Tax=Volvox carteri f. nagariensis TaxID=3068 RepID=D8THC3_VOLCA|nr:uncharacterized protein VOLCADRAFT_102664 [Volvox carteri f. nagariensis]EFJ53046.1 hypothetical protein VOLCADRAFT_102664 [Volvox carteri f. nagariensis]|eukprot:XP_002946051.1 hypothetical protein VOLCADRAFT_102664 [Volvox carteri f. nagariensis]
MYTLRTETKVQCLCNIANISALPPTAQTPPSLDDRLAALCNRITSFFPFWVVLAAAAALWRPELFTWLPTGFITWGLALTMLGMGLTMRLSDFGDVFRRMPQLLLLGMALQYTVMPALGWLFSRHAGLPASLAVGIAVLSACPGGTASNIVAFLARGEMALSILMTAASTLAAVVATPTITAALAGTLVPVDARGLFLSTVQVVLLPVLSGCLANQYFPSAVSRISRYTPAVATLLVAVIVGTTLAGSARAVVASGPALVGAVAGLHASGFLLGYVISKALGLSDKICRTMSIEVGMQNSTLGAVLAALHFADPLTAAPCAVSACTHSVMGSALAAYWQRTAPREEQEGRGEAYEILELYLELLTVRTQLLAKTKELPRDMMEAVSSIIYAAQRISDLPELATLRDLFVGKYGKEYAAEAASDAAASKWQVNANLIRCLLVEPPQPEEKLEMLSEIAQEHGVEWDLSAAAREMGVGLGVAAGGAGGGLGLPHGGSTIGEPAPAKAKAAAAAMAAVGAPGPPYPVIFPEQSPPATGGVSGLNLGVQYTSAQQAAAAAAQAAAQASAAAQFAAQMAAAAQERQRRLQGAAYAAALAGNSNGNGNCPSVAEQAWQAPHPATIPEVPPSDGAVYGLPAPRAPVLAQSTPSPPQVPSPPHADALMPEEDEAAIAAPAAPPPASSGGGASSTVSSAGGYLVRSNSEIQRAYDAANGPPSKGGTVATAPPSPPPSVVAPVLMPPPPPSEKQLSPSAPPPQPPPKAAGRHNLNNVMGFKDCAARRKDVR